MDTYCFLFHWPIKKAFQQATETPWWCYPLGWVWTQYMWVDRNTTWSLQEHGLCWQHLLYIVYWNYSACEHEKFMYSYCVICWGVDDDWLSKNGGQPIQMLLFMLPSPSYPCFSFTARILTSTHLYICTQNYLHAWHDSGRCVQLSHFYWICGDCHFG